MAMTSGRLAAETILEALGKGDFSSRGLQGYSERMRESYVLKDLEKYRRFPSFLETHTELFAGLPQLLEPRAREMLTVNEIPKRTKQGKVWKAIRSQVSPLKLLRLIWDGWRSVR